MARSPRRDQLGPARWFVLPFLALALLAAACGGGDDGDDVAQTSDPEDEALEPQIGGKLVYGIDAESDGYNPQSKRFAQAGHTVASSVFDTLVTWDKDGNIVPHLAESIEPNDDATVWTIKIHDGVVFHTGEPLTAQSVATILDAARTGLVTSAPLLNVTKVEAIDGLTVQITMAVPWPNFPGILTTQAGYIFDPAMLTDPDSGARPVGTGPFEFESWDRENSFRVIRNPDYWRTDAFGNQLPYLEEIEFRILPDAAARDEALESGDIDLLYTLTSASILDLRENEELKVQEYNLGDEDLVSLQSDDVARDADGPGGPSPMRVSPFNNKHARLALAYATDQNAFRESVMLGVNPEATGPFAPGQLGYREDNGYPTYDPDKAREELEAYTADTGQDALRFTYTVADDVDNMGAAQSLVDTWSEVGIEATIFAIPQADLIVNAVIGNYEATDWRNWGQPDPDVDYVWWHSSSVRPLAEGLSLNIAHFKDAEIDAALETARSSTDEDERDQAYATVAARMGSEVPYLWLGRVGWAMASRPEIHGWEAATRNGTVATIGVKSWIGEIWIES